MHGDERKGKKNKTGISKASRMPKIPCSPYRLGDTLKTLFTIHRTRKSIPVILSYRTGTFVFVQHITKTIICCISTINILLKQWPRELSVHSKISRDLLFLKPTDASFLCQHCKDAHVYPNYIVPPME
jgi:hypothetical protein